MRHLRLEHVTPSQLPPARKPWIPVLPYPVPVLDPQLWPRRVRQVPIRQPRYWPRGN